MRRSIAVAVAVAASFMVAPAAQADITSVFTDAIPGSGAAATPVSCEVLDGLGTGQQMSDAGVRFCGSTSPRSTVKSFDGVPIDVNVAFPAGGDGPFPFVAIFHGYAGSKLGLGSMRRWLNQGYAVFSMTTRGFGQSCGSQASRTADPTGCATGYVRLMDTRYEVRDAQELIGELVDEGNIDPAAIGVTGGSYGGGMSMALAALKDRIMLPNGTYDDWESPDGDPLAIAAAAPEIPWSDLSYALVPNGATLDYVDDAPYFGGNGRIGIEKVAWVGALYAQGLGSGFYAPIGTPGADLTGWADILSVGGPYDSNPQALAAIEEIRDHHSSYYIDDSEAPPPMMITSGWTDDLFPATESIRFYNRTRSMYPDNPISLNLMDYGHPRGQNKAATVGAIQGAENTFFAYYLKGEGDEPPSQVQAMTQTCPVGAAPGGPYVADTYPELANGEIHLQRGPRQTVSVDGSLNGADFGTVLPPSSTACAQVPADDNPKTANYRLDPAPDGGYTLIGSPTVIADIGAPGESTQLVARLLDVNPDTNQETLVARGMYRPDVTKGKKTSHQVFQLYPNAYHFDMGHIAKLELLPSDQPYSNTAPGQKPVKVSNLELRLPVREQPGSLHGLVGQTAEKVVPQGYYLAHDFAQGPPNTYIDKKPGKRIHHHTANFEFRSNERGSTFECKLDDSDFEPCDSPQAFSHMTPGSHHTVKFRATDTDDLTDLTPAKYSFRVV